MHTLQCCDTVGWVTGRASELQKILLPQRFSFRGLWEPIWAVVSVKKRPVKQKVKVSSRFMHYPFRLWAYVLHCGIVYLSDDFCRTGAVMLTRCTCIRRASRKRWKRRRPSWRGYTTTFIGQWRRSRRARTTSTTTWNSLCPASAWRRTVWPRWRSNIGRRAAASPNARERSTRWVRSASSPSARFDLSLGLAWC